MNKTSRNYKSQLLETKDNDYTGKNTINYFVKEEIKMTRTQDVLIHAAIIYEYIEKKIKEHVAFSKEIQKGCDHLGYINFIPSEYIEGYDKALINMIRMLSDIKIGG